MHTKVHQPNFMHKNSILGEMLIKMHVLVEVTQEMDFIKGNYLQNCVYSAKWHIKMYQL